jgi:SAM-dependent methyltransferase
VVCGGSLAVVEEQNEAVSEWVRVVRPWGMIADAEFFYHVPAGEELRRRVGEAIGVVIPNWGIEHWRNLYKREDLEVFFEHVEPVKTVEQDDIRRYAESMAARVAGTWSAEARTVLQKRLRELMELFNENLKHMSSALFIFRRIPPDAEPALFV